MKPVVRIVTKWALTLHIYLSMTGFLLVLLFAITGLTLNHNDFGLGAPAVKMSTLMLPADLLAQPGEAAVAAYLVRVLHITSPVTEFRAEADEVDVTFTAPGSRTQVAINRHDGTAQVEAETRGLLGRLDDLHKGLDTGRVWPWIIDITAVLLTISALTGLLTLLSLHGRRRMGLFAGALGLVLLAVIYVLWVPR